MEDRAKVIFGNTISAADYRAACASKERFVKKFGSDADVTYRAELKENEVIGPVFGVKDVRVTKENTQTGMRKRRNRAVRIQSPGTPVLIRKRASLSGTSVWDSAITGLPWPWHPVPMRSDISHTGWISIRIRRQPARR